MKAIVAGHICLDIIPTFQSALRLEPGHLVEVGAATLACGGGVANVGQALLKLGVDAVLIGKIGDDAFGDLIEAALPEAARGLRRAPSKSTSHTVVLNPVGVDRLFLHHAGCNDTFGPDDIDPDALADADLCYFGYPPLMRRTYQDGGAGLAALLARLRGLGLTTVVDMAMPDPEADAGRDDWRAFLARVLPHVDFFLPSLDEICFMLKRAAPSGTTALGAIAEALLELGTRVVGLKLGDEGFYLRSAALNDGVGLGRAVAGDGAVWSARELWSPVFSAEVRGTTGAGDATVAGFIKALSERQTPERCLTLANAVGASSVEALDAVSGVTSFERITARLAAGWPRAAREVDGGYWRAGSRGVYYGPRDQKGAV